MLNQHHCWHRQHFSQNTLYLDDVCITDSNLQVSDILVRHFMVTVLNTAEQPFFGTLVRSPDHFNRLYTTPNVWAAQTLFWTQYIFGYPGHFYWMFRYLMFGLHSDNTLYGHPEHWLLCRTGNFWNYLPDTNF